MNNSSKSGKKLHNMTKSNINKDKKNINFRNKNEKRLLQQKKSKTKKLLQIFIKWEIANY